MYTWSDRCEITKFGVMPYGDVNIDRIKCTDGEVSCNYCSCANYRPLANGGSSTDKCLGMHQRWEHSADIPDFGDQPSLCGWTPDTECNSSARIPLQPFDISQNRQTMDVASMCIGITIEKSQNVEGGNPLVDIFNQLMHFPTEPAYSKND